MPTYTVHEPPRKGDDAPNPERFVFVRDGFYFWAFVLGPVWMLARRLWLVLFGYAAVNIGLAFLLHVLDAHGVLRAAAMLALALLVGFEAATLLRFSYRKWRMVGVVTGIDAEDAERRFFSRWVEGAGDRPPVTVTAKAAPTSSATLRGAPQGSHVIGLFPEPGG
ncbi:MAG: DUF2628 domain-containing protein, partial [Pseudolabrys sp.]|nr:DUF2628 domain-containing protein [Pseudolabrys sp.]